LAVFTAELSAAYSRATGALAVFTAELSAAYSRAAGALEVFPVDPQSTTYK